MAKVAAHGLSSKSLQFGRCAMKTSGGVKRKTPSELRGEQLKRRNVIELDDDSQVPFMEPVKNSTGTTLGIKKSDSMKHPRINKVYPVTKSGLSLPGKENVKENISIEQTDRLNNFSIPTNLDDKTKPPLSGPENTVTLAAAAKGGTVRACKMTEKCSGNTFRSVAELSLGGEGLSGLAAVDMDKALKGLVAHEPPANSCSPADSSETRSGYFCSECHIPGQKTPLDFTLKTNMRVVSSSSVNWFHRFITSGTYIGMSQFSFQNGCSEDQIPSHSSGFTSSQAGFTSASQVLNSKALHSWVYPQSSLPASVILALTSSAAAEGDFISKRLLAWSDSFRSLYYMLRKSACNIFYVCTTQFVVMFTSCDSLGTAKRLCNAYISQSTRGLRSLLREHDVCFSMPLCHSKVEQVNTEDLVELQEIEKHNLGQTRNLHSLSDVDNTPQSLLAFNGNKDVHGLYDFLLNYRSFLTSLSGVDVPVLYSPVPFQNASLSAPEVNCKELKRVDQVAFPSKGSNMKDGEMDHNSSNGLCYSIEINDEYLPPWIISNLCAIMGSDGRSFEASFKTEPSSIGLNVALESVCQKSESAVEESNQNFGIPDVIVSPYLRSGILKGLKYCSDGYTASLSPV